MSIPTANLDPSRTLGRFNIEGRRTLGQGIWWLPLIEPAGNW
jgi:hypothetical protein